MKVIARMLAFVLFFEWVPCFAAANTQEEPAVRPQAVNVQNIPCDVPTTPIDNRALQAMSHFVVKIGGKETTGIPVEKVCRAVTLMDGSTYQHYRVLATVKIDNVTLPDIIGIQCWSDGVCTAGATTSETETYWTARTKIVASIMVVVLASRILTILKHRHSSSPPAPQPQQPINTSVTQLGAPALPAGTTAGSAGTTAATTTTSSSTVVAGATTGGGAAAATNNVINTTVTFLSGAPIP